MKVAFYTLGCKVNAYESEVAINKFKAKGYEIVPFSELADIYVINTCSVTNTADSKSRKEIRNAHKRNPNAVVAVMGCYSQAKPEEVKDIEGVSVVIGNKNKNAIVELVEEYLENHKQIVKIFDLTEACFEDMVLDKFENHTRAFVKIQDGCNNYCSYCIIPYTRGTVRSKEKDTILSEVNTLVNNGYKEIVLTGIHTGHYGSDLDNYDFSDLLSDLEKIEGLERIRISSVEITELNDKFLNVLKNSKKIVNHIHIPLQSGCDKTLKAMNRKYNMEFYFNKINEIRKIRKNIAITTDVIVGFPDETDEDFNITKENIKKLKFAELHVFPYSRRQGTRAALMKNQVDGNIKKQRVKELIEISEKSKDEYYKQFLNKEEFVLTETYNDKIVTGHLSNYGKVMFDGDIDDLNKMIKVKLTSYEKGIFNGVKVK